MLQHKTLFNRSAQLFLTFVLFALGQTSWALEKTPFTQSAFEKLQSEGKVVLVDIYADWCGTCKKQQKALSEYVKNHPDRELHIMSVDFDNQKNVVQAFKAPRQSTLLLYKGKQQFWYAVAESRVDVITDKIEQAFKFVPKKSK